MYKNLKEISESVGGVHGPIQPVMLVGGRVATCFDMDILVRREPGKPLVFQLQEKSTAQQLSQLSWPEIEDRLNCMMLAYFYEDYARIKRHKLFAKIYLSELRPVSYLENGLVTTKECNTYPCMMCGIILPEHLITIDHHHPQAGGELLALLKVFRACGLTLNGPRGSLGQAYLKHAHQSYLNLASAIIYGDDWPLLEPSKSTSDDVHYEQRNSLTNQGILIYSLLVWSMDIPRVIQNCMDSLLNLKPLCQSCNSSKSNSSATRI